MANRLSQIAEEIITLGGNPNTRTSQVAQEIITTSGNPKARVSQVTQEVLTRLQTPNVRLSQLVREALVQVPVVTTEPIYKLQPHRSMHLRGTDRFGAMSSLWNASDSGFNLTGVFRDVADFSVVMLWDADDYFGHYQSTKYLPDFDFSGITLSFDIHTSGVMPLDDPRFEWIPWRSLSYTLADGQGGTVNLKPYATQTSGTLTAASTTITVATPGTPTAFNRVAIWYQNDVFVWWPAFGFGSATDTAAQIAAYLATQINTQTATLSMPLTATVSGSTISITCTKPGIAGNTITLYTQQDNTNNVTLSPANTAAPLTGGVSDATWNVSLDFSALGINQIKQAWLTFAPQLQAASAAYSDTEWTVTVSNWTVTDPSGKRGLKVAGPGSVRVGSRDGWASYSGSSWAEEASNQAGGTGWFYRGFAHRMGITGTGTNTAAGDSVTITYYCQSTHDLYVGTSLYTDRGIVSVTLDGAAQADLDCFYNNATAPVVTRRKLASSVAPGKHTVVLTLKTTQHAALGAWDANSAGYYFYFDYLEAAVASDVPLATITYSNLMPATDFDTDHTYKLSPQRLLWLLQKMGFAGDINQYMGVFWWNQRKRVGGSYPVATVTIGGTWAYNDSAFVNIGGTVFGKTVYPDDTNASIAAHFAYYINSASTGVRATASGNVLTLTTQTPEFSFTVSLPTPGTSAGTITLAGNLSSGVEGSWDIDDTVAPVINKPVTDWSTDWWQQVKNAGLTGVAAFSMELVNPPDATGHIYGQRFADGTVVTTDTGFGGLKSTQCTFNATMQAYQKQAYKEMAGLMNAAGLTPRLQFGEFLWWFFPGANPSDTKGMAFYDADTAAAAVTALGRALATFTHPTDDPAVNSHADADFLRGLIYTHTSGIASFVQATYPAATFEVLWPYDVNYPTPTPIAGLGGRLNNYVNLPSQWMAKAGSGLARFKMEALAFGATERSLTLAQQAITFPTVSPLSWSLADTAYLIPVFNGGCPWTLEYLATVTAQMPRVNFWALDHIMLLSWPVNVMPSFPAYAQLG